MTWLGQNRSQWGLIWPSIISLWIPNVQPRAGHIGKKCVLSGCEKCWLLMPSLHKDTVADGMNLYICWDICLFRVLQSELFRARGFPLRLVSAEQGGCTGLDEDSKGFNAGWAQHQLPIGLPGDFLPGSLVLLNTEVSGWMTAPSGCQTRPLTLFCSVCWRSLRYLWGQSGKALELELEEVNRGVNMGLALGWHTGCSLSCPPPFLARRKAHSQDSLSNKERQEEAGLGGVDFKIQQEAI